MIAIISNLPFCIASCFCYRCCFSYRNLLLLLFLLFLLLSFAANFADDWPEEEDQRTRAFRKPGYEMEWRCRWRTVGLSDGRSVGHQNECGNARRAESLLNNCSSSSNNSLLRSPSCALPLLLAPRFSCGCGSGSGSEAQHAFFSCFLDYFFCLFNFSALALP